ncbi:DNA-binding response regulator, OmpR family, contains REC and winged-helix (wHTH) domain [Pseudarthrobacter equi]|uniref:DNA-binding response regulator, OmpR family, contains REC and winged-helix (WHTH) domain n=1 Tax=Pseudarthrobacter equi TaxID=728066 RepID=A0A1H2B3B4_9MICC|nr:response regulator transcription factor [Pseudarthrobacter equi]SDT52557.1 DNA-binding response regulator, OmpR family, contains REC and winged-helix (wHTH) domain [Pseudarthrobacter equi]
MGHETANRRAVVVEDDKDIQMLLNRTLSMQGFDVVVAGNGMDGLARIREHQPELITLDLNLPDLDGTEVCRRLREFSDAYVVMITARVEEIDELLGLQIGADDFVTKPFSPRALGARITAMFRRPRPGFPDGGAPAVAELAAAEPEQPAVEAEADSEATVHGPVRVDTESRTVHVAGNEVVLTRTEFDLLAAFVGAPRRVWTKESLLRRVWGDEWATDEHLVEVHVGNLRRKIRAGGSDTQIIRTVRGVGYGLVPAAALS